MDVLEKIYGEQVFGPDVDWLRTMHDKDLPPRNR
jgi:hypothetical protein